jgi:hypothetical protein
VWLAYQKGGLIEIFIMQGFLQAPQRTEYIAKEFT